MPGCQDIDEHHQAESQNDTERRGPVSFEPGLGRNVLEKQIQNTSRGKKHRRADKLGKACRDVPAECTRNWSRQNHDNHDVQRPVNTIAGDGENFTVRVKPLGQVLQAYQYCEQRCGRRAERIFNGSNISSAENLFKGCPDSTSTRYPASP